MDYPYDLGPYSRTVTTSSADAQRWFDRGLNWCFGFHHEEAIACFEKALAADPNCAMAHLGIGYAAGPNYNFPWRLMDPAGKAAAADARRSHDYTWSGTDDSSTFSDYLCIIEWSAPTENRSVGGSIPPLGSILKSLSLLVILAHRFHL
jgi:hypothetical protein